MKATEQYFSCWVVCYAAQGGSNFWVCGWNPKVWPFKWKLLIEQYFPLVLFIMLYEVIVRFEEKDLDWKRRAHKQRRPHPVHLTAGCAFTFGVTDVSIEAMDSII